ncbi:lipase family protein [Actinomadura macrotermitis]|uniref:Putative inactive lipase n=1 Tax=Actinomadura macrotermitis TaxID=2585200 RepID=A0A7K0BUC5_9ACTN|nr:lipase family protein [Actinomadura macrotermitis]MQY04779.1 putative inactive lipase [Actinomadura macrotermitis]
MNGMLSRSGRVLAPLALAVSLCAGSVTAAVAAPVRSPYQAAAPGDPAPAGDEFYTPPSPLPEGKPGDIIRWRPSKAGPPAARSLANAWQVMYLSTDGLGKPNVVTGTVLVPKDGDPATTPIVGFGPGTSGPAFRCAPSKFIDQGAFYEQAALNGMLKAGYAVAVTDYEGYHTDPKTTYMTGRSMGPALMDGVRAAQRLSATGLSANAPVVFRGYSQGGGASMWAGQLQPTYAPELKLVGVVGGGVPADLVQVALPLNGLRGSGFLFDAMIGLDNAYPELKLDSYLNEDGRALFASLNKDACTLELLTDYKNKQMSKYMTKSPFSDKPWQSRVVENRLGSAPIKAPVFHYHGTKDDIVDFDQDKKLRDKYCALGVQDTWQTYDVDHITGVARGNADALTFIADRFAGKAPTPNC